MTPDPVSLDAYLAQPTQPEVHLSRLLAGRGQTVIFDIGACEGEDSIRYARMFPRGRVFSFEPLPVNQRIVCENFKKYGVLNAELQPFALSDREGEADFHVSDGRPPELFNGNDWNYGNKSSSLLPPASNEPMYGWIQFQAPIKVRCDTLDHFCTERGINRVDFIHIDVQGAEYLVLSGARRVLPQTTAIWLEVTERALYRGQPLRTQIENFLRAEGFSLVYEDRREVEGDQFYVNRRFIRARIHLARCRFADAVAKLRRAGGRLKRRMGV